MVKRLSVGLKATQKTKRMKRRGLDAMKKNVHLPRSEVEVEHFYFEFKLWVVRKVHVKVVLLWNQFLSNSRSRSLSLPFFFLFSLSVSTGFVRFPNCRLMSIDLFTFDIDRKHDLCNLQSEKFSFNRNAIKLIHIIGVTTGCRSRNEILHEYREWLAIIISCEQ